ncbi:breast carcinoma-amplified sequence 1 isoform X3 [Talpa occidentalis]|uniref:breast carcinoma-amplified sequence 1 isoform X3 n=1 Tax=Talpa occidentalis TaxID=50954 RepID=UPI0023F923AA|nr:breast carcinoma-amplified sequence 1 isoform X3 [Talpa occidentalis]
MGNQMSVLQRVEDQENDSETDTPKVAAGSQCEQNGAPVMLSTHTIQYYSEVDLGISIQQDNVATSSSDTMELSAVEDANRENLGREANPEPPAAKSRFFLTLSRSVPGRAGDQATDSSRASVTPDVSSSEAAGNKGLSESRALPTAAAGRPAPDKTPGQAPAPDGGSSATWGPVPLSPESGGAAPSKPKDASIFDKIFKLDKGREKVPSDRRQEAESEECPDQADCIQGHPSHHVPAEADIVDSEGRGGQEIAALSDSLPGDPEELEAVKEDPQITNITENNPIMSFFKTLVSPNKAEAKKDLEDPGAEKPPATAADLKSDNVNFAPQDTQAAAKNPAATEIAKDGAKEKGAATPLPLAKMFWKKTSNSTEKATTPPEPEPPVATPKGKESSSKDKKAAAEVNKQKNNKQEAKEAAQCELAVVEVNSLQNGDKALKRPERQRQSLGGFLKGLGPKRMSDAQVQTDPVSIGPAGKSK